VATIVLAIGLLAVLTAFSLAARAAGASTNDTVATFLAQQKLAEIQLIDPRSLTAGTKSGSFAPAYPHYSWQLTFHRPTELHVVRVDLTIFAPEAGQRREFRFTTALF